MIRFECSTWTTCGYDSSDMEHFDRVEQVNEILTLNFFKKLAPKHDAIKLKKREQNQCNSESNQLPATCPTN